jgi:hypothetical protein
MDDVKFCKTSIGVRCWLLLLLLLAVAAVAAACRGIVV